MIENSANDTKPSARGKTASCQSTPEQAAAGVEPFEAVVYGAWHWVHVSDAFAVPPADQLPTGHRSQLTPALLAGHTAGQPLVHLTST